MSSLSRRTFLTGSAAAAAGMLAASPAAALTRPRPARQGASPTRVPLVREDHRVVVIGSGFGGGVSALRLAEAGVDDIVVLERGRRWVTGPDADTFPRPSSPDERILWYGSAPSDLRGLLNRTVLPDSYAGVLEAIANPNMTIMTAAGVGGGSLVYQGMTLQPSEAVFAETFPAALDWRLMDRVHYPRVARMLQVATAPDELVESPTYFAPRVFRRNAIAAGYDVEKIPMPIDWDFALAELRGEMAPSYTNGDCALGVNNGGKHSVDVTYIAQAEATGRVTVEPLHNVTGVARTGAGRWQVFVDRTDVRGEVIEQKVLTCNALVMAAGSVNTTKLLLRAKALETIPNLPDDLGGGWGSNADRIVTWTNPVDDFGPEQGGPVIFGSKEWEDPVTANTVIQASLPPLGINTRTTMLVGFGVSDARGTWAYDSATDDSSLSWDREADGFVHQRILARMRDIAGPTGVLGDSNLPVPSTWHPLGGACMETVCDLEGRVHDLPGLYVLDGALIPGTTAACNPSMTIAAVAERAMDHIVREDVGAVI